MFLNDSLSPNFKRRSLINLRSEFLVTMRSPQISDSRVCVSTKPSSDEKNSLSAIISWEVSSNFSLFLDAELISGEIKKSLIL